MRRGVAPRDHIVANVETDDAGCWIWQLSLVSAGYGAIAIPLPSGRRRPSLAHRVAYETFVGPIPEGLQIDHLCRNRRCVNPDHLEPVTPRENVLRGIGPSALNAARSACSRGHAFTDENTHTGRNGGRRCRKCSAAHSRRYAAAKGKPSRLKTHCKQGHEFTPENTRISPRSGRICRTCQRLSDAKYRAGRKARGAL